MYPYELHEPSTVAKTVKEAYFAVPLEVGEKFQICEETPNFVKFTVYQYVGGSAPLMPMQGGYTRFKILDLVEFFLKERRPVTNSGISLS